METPRPDVAEVTAEPDPSPSARRRGRVGEHALVFVVVALGGAIGACGRYAASLLWPTASGAFPWTTLAINVTGCAVMGLFMVLISEVWSAHRLLRPFVGTGILGGYTTFSSYAADIQHLLTSGHAATGLAYLALTVLAALGSTWAAAALTQRVFTRRSR